MTNKIQLCRIIYYSLAALDVSSDIFAHFQEHLNCITASGLIHSKQVQEPRNNKLSYTVASCWPFSYITYIVMHGNKDIKLINAKQAKGVHTFKNIKRKIYRTTAAIWFLTKQAGSQCVILEAVIQFRFS
jgi:hypothetical protein